MQFHSSHSPAVLVFQLAWLLELNVQHSNCETLDESSNPTSFPHKEEIVRLTSFALDLSSTYWTNPIAFAQIYDTMEKVKKLQPTNPLITKTEEQHKESVDKMMEWAKPLFRLDGVEVKDLGDGRGFGLHATKKLSEGHIFIQVPLNYTIQANLFRPKLEKCLGSQLYDGVKYRSFWSTVIYVAANLMYERMNPDSLLKPYIDSLPTQFGIATYFTPQELVFLEGSGAYESTIWTYQEVVLQYTTLFQRLVPKAGSPDCEELRFRPETFTYELYLWAVSVALTRNLNEHDMGSLMIPVWDNGNHHNTEHNYYQKAKFDMDKNGNRLPGGHGYLVGWLYKDVPKGGEIYHEYKGTFLEMDEFYTSWDIINEDAPVAVEIRVRPSDPDYPAKKLALKALNAGIDFKTNVYPALPNLPCLASEFEKLLAAATGQPLNKLDSKTWQETWKFLKKRIEIQLYFHKRTPDQIEKLLGDKSLGYISRQALRYSLEEQLSLIRSLDRLEKMINDSQSIMTSKDIQKLKVVETEEDEKWQAPLPAPPKFSDIKPYMLRDEL